jgi:protein-disulfide isomerase
MNRQQLYIGLGAAVVLAIGVAAYLWFSGGSTDLTLPPAASSRVALLPTDHAMGSPNAPIQMIEYAAPVCPHCAHFDAEQFPQLKQNYIDTGKVFYVFRVFPLQPADVAAEAIARCMPKDNYFSFIELLFRNQQKWDPEYGIQDIHGGLVEVSRIAGMSAERVDQCIADQAVAKNIEQVGEDAEKKFGVSGTPSFVVNGVLVHTGAFPWDDLKAMLDSKLPKKK